MKLWDKGIQEDVRIDRFTVGRDRELDLQLAPYDVLGTMAHITMLSRTGLLPREDLAPLLRELRKIYDSAVAGDFVIGEDIEDVHSQVENMLTEALGDLGRKVHTARSRNDQILVDINLFTRARIERTVGKVKRLFETLQACSERYKDVLMPGYTHLQVAMPSSFGLWFGAYAESLADDLTLLGAVWDVVNCNPLGSAAGYGSSMPIDRSLTTRLLGFADLDYNVVYAQMCRGRLERMVAQAYAGIAETLGRLAADACLYNSQNFGFLRLPDSMTTGSSIMPHKKNPDVFELIRSHCNRLQGIAPTIRMMTGNLPSGYFRDMQLIKEVYLPLFDETDDLLDIAAYALEGVTVRQDIMDDPRYRLAFSVEKVNAKVLAGVPFREAYRQVGREIMDGQFTWEGALSHTHEGSIGNLCNPQIAAKFRKALDRFTFGPVNEALQALLDSAGKPS